MIHLEKKGNTLVKKIDSKGSDFLDIPRTLTFLNEDENEENFLDMPEKLKKKRKKLLEQVNVAY